MKLWGGRFQAPTDELVDSFQSSLPFDRRLYRQDILGSIAHARMLGKCGIIPAGDAQRIVEGLKQILDDLEAGKAELPAVEDIHTAVEVLLTARLGEAGKMLHTARSRNDQVALDLRLYLREEILEICGLLLALQEALLRMAGQHLETVMPGYTHLQKAQPVTLAHHLLAYLEMLERDGQRLLDCYGRTNVLPLGAGALAGTTFPIDRQMVAGELGFAAISENSLDAVSDRDFAVEFCAAAALIMAHLSRFGEELVLWSSDEFRFVEMGDAFATGSSIMPQKKNPDVAELVRGKSGRVYGDLLALLTMLKGLPLAYNKDLQEDKEALFDAVHTVRGCLQVFLPMLQGLRFDRERLREGAGGGFINATEVADYLAARGLPFREAHAVAGKLVLVCLEKGIRLEELPLEEYRRFSSLFGEDILDTIAPERAVRRRDVPGGPAPQRVAEALARARRRWEERAGRLAEMAQSRGGD